MNTGPIGAGRGLWRAVLAFALLSPLSAWAEDVCPPEGTDAGSLRLLKQQDFMVEDAATRNMLAMRLLGCLSSPDPALRDGIAYEALTAWLRGNALEARTREQLRDSLYAMLKEPDAEGFRQPFAALVLSEVARTDRIEPWMTPKERMAMVDEAVRYLRSVQDYRGFDNTQGWRHGVAHGSDWLMQLALNPALERPQLEAMLGAVAAQAVPESGHAYVFGEPGRLARPVLYIAKRGVLADADWSAWFLGLPERIGEREKAYSDTAWLARRHDLLAFLTGVYLEADQSADAQIKALKAPAVLALKIIP
ncbi:MAG: DUF2785 domain-containing protein [Pseudoxanthomonas sp.]